MNNLKFTTQQCHNSNALAYKGSQHTPCSWL